MDEDQEILQMINSGAPAACELEDCRDLRTCVTVLLQFAHRAVNPPATREQAVRYRWLLDHAGEYEISRYPDGSYFVESGDRSCSGAGPTIEQAIDSLVAGWRE